eukprot:CAMPEP_0185752960 /NCGR_PEP_ID=MMETSP1174-20130828/11719_1 /TAXON_ID=35687 /ORGANISM="Dictyocha speculum, Strain CCMP1381" /LENGTH=831 /DNA_ID=CAMNT_0028430619 /DNA_START=61 /DNA_END=2555 /DNA_ORIENTATION=+
MADVPTKDAASNIRVAVRCRPLNNREVARGEKSIFDIQNGEACLTDPKDSGIHRFGFDFVFGHTSAQSDTFEAVGVPTLDNALKGYNGTIFAYGQTGSGKTHTMQGLVGEDESQRGLIPRMNEQMFKMIAAVQEVDPEQKFLVTCSLFEIYNEVINDLFSCPEAPVYNANGTTKRTGLQIKEHPLLGIYIKDLKEIVVDSAGKAQDLLNEGVKNRVVAKTGMNSASSRSHCVFVIRIHQKNQKDKLKNLSAKLNLVDLAGSERASRTQATGAALKEGSNINKSLSALGNVINALVDKANGKKNVFVPYRNSKLTRVLQESLGGNSLTSMVAALSPSETSYDETLSTLKYAARVKTIRLQAVKNEVGDTNTAKLESEIAALKKMLAEQQSQSQQETVDNENFLDQVNELQAALKDTWEEKARMSSDYENVQRAMRNEYEETRQLLRVERERRWQRIEQKEGLSAVLEELEEVWEDTELVDAQQEISQRLQEIMELERKEQEQTMALGLRRRGFLDEMEYIYGDEDEDEDGLSKTLVNLISKQTKQLFDVATELLHTNRSIFDSHSSLHACVLHELAKWRRELDEYLVEQTCTTTAAAAVSIPNDSPDKFTALPEIAVLGLAAVVQRIRHRKTDFMRLAVKERLALIDMEPPASILHKYSFSKDTNPPVIDAGKVLLKALDQWKICFKDLKARILAYEKSSREIELTPDQKISPGTDASAVAAAISAEEETLKENQRFLELSHDIVETLQSQLKSLHNAMTYSLSVLKNAQSEQKDLATPTPRERRSSGGRRNSYGGKGGRESSATGKKKKDKGGANAGSKSPKKAEDQGCGL